MLRLVRRFLAVSLVQTALGVMTGVIAARSLGPFGRGDLAAVLVPLGLLPYVLALGLPTFTSRSVAAGRDLGTIIGTTAVLAAVVGLIAAPLCIVFLHAYAGHKRSLETVLVIGFALAPVTLVSGVLSDAGLGLQRWSAVTVQRLIPPVATLSGYGVLVSLGELTPAAAAWCAVAGGLLAIAPFVPVARLARPVRFDLPTARDALRIGPFAWLIQTSQLLNHRLDQLIMIPLISRQQLGFYAISVTVSGIANSLSPAIGTVLYPKLAARENIDLAATVRRGIAAVAVTSLAVAASSPFLIPLAFGEAFRPAIPMLLVLLLGNAPLAGANLLASAYAARGRIALASLSEVAAVAVTVGGLLLVLPGFGGLGAAVVSTIAYTVNFVWLLFIARRDFGGRGRSYIFLDRSDVAALRAAAHRALSDLRGNSPAAPERRS